MAALKAANTKLEARIQELERRLNQNSKNSHLPPSQDKHQRPAIKPAFERGKGKKNGGQPGHKGTTLERSDQIDEFQILIPEKCTCGNKLSKEPYDILETRQVRDLPPLKDHVKEYQLGSCICSKCHRTNRGEYPIGINAPVQYGPRIKALVVLLNVENKVPFKKVHQLFVDLFGIHLNESTIHNANKKCYELLEPTMNQIQAEMIKSPVIHADETGINLGTTTVWAHVNSTVLFTYLYTHPNRGYDAYTDFESVISQYEGTIIHDFLKAYFKLLRAKHGMCNSHILRELESQKEELRIWADQFKKFLLNVKDSSFSSRIKNKVSILSQYKRILKNGIKEEPPPIRRGSRGREKKSSGLNLIERLLNHIDQVMAFAFDKNIPFTNNQAERDLRHCKTKMKVSGCFRSELGAKYYMRITSFTSTLRKNSLNVYEGLCQLFNSGKYELIWS